MMKPTKTPAAVCLLINSPANPGDLEDPEQRLDRIFEESKVEFLIKARSTGSRPTMKENK